MTTLIEWSHVVSAAALVVIAVAAFIQTGLDWQTQERKRERWKRRFEDAP